LDMGHLKLYLIAAACENMGIGYKNDLPWKLKNEMAYFNRMTHAVSDTGSGNINVVLMGRNTWDSIPDKFRPLKNRLNVVLTTRDDIKSLPGVVSFSNWDEAMIQLSTSHQFKNVEKVWVIGGSSVYKKALESVNCHRIYLTRILKDFECDVFFPQFDATNFNLIRDPAVSVEDQEENGIKYRFEVYERKV